jgi:hypothetical protein
MSVDAPTSSTTETRATNRTEWRFWPVFLAGVLAGLLIAWAGSAVVRISRNALRLGAEEVLTDGSIRQRIGDCGVSLPELTGNLYYSVSGFVDCTEFIAFSAPPGDSMRAAQSFASRKSNGAVLNSGNRSRHDFVNNGPIPATPLWDIGTVANGLMCEGDGFFVLVDTDTNRVYVANWTQ